MQAMLLNRPVEREQRRLLEPSDVPAPLPGPGEVRVRVRYCGVCRTDLDLVEGRLAAREYPLIPGHQVVGRIDAIGSKGNRFREGDRVGVAWIHSACGGCRWCTAGQENLCPKFCATGCDAPGGFAEWLTVPTDFVHPLPQEIGDAEAAPLLCAGAIGWRSLRLTNLQDGEPLGLTGFGASAHLVLQLARHRFPRSPVFVFARSGTERAFARELGAAWVGDTDDGPPEALSAIIDTTPAWHPVIEALRRLAPGGRLVINAIRKSSRDQGELTRLDYAQHLWNEREVKSVANVTRQDVREMLAASAELRLRPTIQIHPLREANSALQAIAAGGLRGAHVLELESVAPGSIRTTGHTDPRDERP